MAENGLFGPTDRLLRLALDGVAQRQRVTAHNIANVDTPGYKRFRIDFESALKAAAGAPAKLPGKVTHPGHIPIGGGRIQVDPVFRARRVNDTAMRNDGNNVDIEVEMTQLAKDEVLYSALADTVRRRYAMLRDAITEGRQ